MTHPVSPLGVPTATALRRKVREGHGGQVGGSTVDRKRSEDMREPLSGTPDVCPGTAETPRCVLCDFNRCHFCETETDVELSTLDSPVGAFRVPACGQCCEKPRKLACPEAVRLVLDHPADDDPDNDERAAGATIIDGRVSGRRAGRGW